MSAGTLHKTSTNYDVKRSNGHNLDEIIITNAGFINTTDFACMVDWNHKKTALATSYDDKKKTLTIKGQQGFIDLWQMRDVHFGSSHKDDLNLCDLSTNFYRYNGEDWDLNYNNVSVPLHNMRNDSEKDMTLKLSILDTGVINIYWNFANAMVHMRQFEVP